MKKGDSDTKKRCYLTHMKQKYIQMPTEFMDELGLDIKNTSNLLKLSLNDEHQVIVEAVNENSVTHLIKDDEIMEIMMECFFCMNKHSHAYPIYIHGAHRYICFDCMLTVKQAVENYLRGCKEDGKRYERS